MAREKRNPILRSICAGVPIPILLLLPSCASWLAPQPPTIPTPLQIRTYLESANTLANGPNVSLGVVNGITVATNGYTLVNTECDAFFSAVFRMSFDTSFNRQEVTLAGAFAAGTLAAVKASAQSIAIAALAATLLGASLDNFQNFALLTPYPNQVHKLVQSAMSTYVQSAPPNDATKMTSVDTALFYVSGYAALCTYAGIGDLVSQALQKAQPVDTTKGKVTPPPSPAPPPPGPAPLGIPTGAAVLPRIEIQ
jgi:hypothetical protein